jgi:hypothetical protein
MRYAQHAYATIASGLLRQIQLPLLCLDEEEYQFDLLLLRMHDSRNRTLNHSYAHLFGPPKFAPVYTVIDGAWYATVVVVAMMVACGVWR